MSSKEKSKLLSSGTVKRETTFNFYDIFYKIFLPSPQQEFHNEKFPKATKKKRVNDHLERKKERKNLLRLEYEK